jgi:hypothetical protein
LGAKSTFNPQYFWPVLYRSGNRMVAFANVEPRFWSNPPEKSSAVLQMSELAVPLQVDPGKLCSLTRFETLVIAAEDARAAAVNDTVTMAAPDVLMRFDSDLKVVAAFTGRFVPKQISLDEAGWACLFVEVDQRRELWLVTPEGVRVANCPVLADVGDPVQPPLIGYDRRMFVLTKSHLVAIDPHGQTLWTSAVPGSAVGAGVTTNGQVLLTSASSLLAYGPDGQARELFRSSEDITSPPIITSHHEILLCEGKKLHCLEVHG